MSDHLKRRQLEEKQAFQNCLISTAFFPSVTPTCTVATNNPAKPSTPHTHQLKSHYHHNRVHNVWIRQFSSSQDAKVYLTYLTAQHQQQNTPKKRWWAHYCQDISHMQHILYHPSKIYVPMVEIPLRDLINEVSQMVIVDGVAIEELLKRSGSPLLKFMEEDVLSPERYFYQWRVWSYLQGDGQKKYRTEPYKMTHQGLQWYPPVPNSITRSSLVRSQKVYLAQLLAKLTRKKQQIQECMVFCIYNMHCAVEIVISIVLATFEHLKGDFVKYFYLISDILFNTKTHNYRRLFARMIPFIVYRYSQLWKEKTSPLQSKYKGQLKALIQYWEIKFIFDDNYTKGLLFLLEDNHQQARQIKGIHQKLRTIGNMEDQRDSQMELEKICFDNGIPLLQTQKEESMRLVNEYLWLNDKEQIQEPAVDSSVDGEPLTTAEMLKIKQKQVKTICCGNLPISYMMEKNWQTKSKASSIDSS